MSDRLPIPFIDLQAQQERIRPQVDAAIRRVLDHGQYIMGPEVLQFEHRLAEFCGIRHAIGCANGTDALVLVLRAWDVAPEDAVFVPSFTFAATAEAVVLAGGTPVFVDVDEATFNICPENLEKAIVWATKNGLRPRVVVPVDLFGLPTDHASIARIAEKYDLLVLDDAAQGLGGSIDGRVVGSFGHATATSFFPAKPLGCYGDGGAVLTADDSLVEKVRSIQVHGKGKTKYENIQIGMNSRLDTIQAAILIEKLNVFQAEIELRNSIARRYDEAFSGKVLTQHVPAGRVSIWAQYTMVMDEREDFVEFCRSGNIPTQCYYPIPLHRQVAYRDYPLPTGGCPTSEKLSEKLISIPMHSYLKESDQDYIIENVLSFVAGRH